MVWVRAAVLCWHAGSLKLGQLLLPSLEESYRNSVKFLSKDECCLLFVRIRQQQRETHPGPSCISEGCVLRRTDIALKEEGEPQCAIETECKKQHL